MIAPTELHERTSLAIIGGEDAGDPLLIRWQAVIRLPEDPIARTACGEEIPESCPPQEHREGIHDEELVGQEIEWRSTGTMVLGIARPILKRRPAIDGVPEQEWRHERKGDQAA